ncbi:MULTISPECIES: metallophosphoesterase [unclassified Breznakia]|uniref:metallophosphoesterase n=1 Tax=unclassified Breznakia TaxID=2623764 RepID=UPI002406A944|nr:MULTISPECIES: metallophosphoesterase [unclassified Breznakia]MDF9838332.1 hypothetical protein [Breznakia sp. PFB2-8]MDF9860348.1 hypothetical protein [Breznakia sp. PH5-24]MDL2276138.1 metallophosphoesterase [Breznakia sp. OttesenSCG-928-G09]
MKKIGITIITIVTLFTAALSGSMQVEGKVISHSAATSIVDVNTKKLDKFDVVDPNMEWRYHDGDNDPNEGTWYQGWNKRNGWAYPEGWLDWGSIPMLFSEESWPTYKGTAFSTDPVASEQQLAKTSDDKAKSTYFLRHTFTLTQEQAESVYAIQIKAKYNDAMTMYVNGTAVGGFHNIPTSNYKKNMEYGSQVAVADNDAIEESFIVDDVSCITNGFVPGKYKKVYDPVYKMDVLELEEAEKDEYGNTFMNITIAVELHANSPEDAQASFELMEFILNPDESGLAGSGNVKNVAVNVGADENTINFAWNALSSSAGYVQVAEGSDPAAFSLEKAKTYKADSTKLAYTKFTSTNYYANKATIDIEPGKDYIYRVGNDGGYSPVYKLHTQSINDGYEAIFLSDAQIGTGTIPTDTLGWTNTLNLALGKFPNASFIANTGDFVDTANKESEYDAYFTPEILASYPTATAVGNHDIASNYGNHFNESNMSALGASAANSDYYYTYGNVLYMVLNTSNINHVEHIQFMEETLEATADQDFDWTVVMFHQSIYASGKQSTSDDVAPRKEVFVPAFDRLGIDIVLMGHDHCYARTKQMKNFEPVDGVTYEDAANTIAVNPEGTLYLTTSSASGSKYYDLVEGGYEYLAFSAQPKVPTFSHLTFSEDTFTMTAYRTDTMEAFDTYTIKKTNKVDVDKTKLNALLKEAKAIKTTKYTEASVNTLKSAIKAAEAVMNDANATQAEVDAAVANLQKAIDGLKLKSAASTQTDGNPSTGDAMATNALMLITLLSGAVAIATYIKRKRAVSE